MKYSIRLADKNDLPAMLAIYAYYVRESVASFEYEPPSLSEFTRRFDTFTEIFPWFVLEEGGRIIGYSYAHRYHDRAAYYWTAECTVYLDSGCLGRGCGRALYTCLIEALKMQGYKTAIGIISYPNENSEGLHKALGFTQLGVLRNSGWKAGAWRSSTWYALPLGNYDVPPSAPLSIGEVKDKPEFSALMKKSAGMIKE